MYKDKEQRQWGQERSTWWRMRAAPHLVRVGRDRCPCTQSYCLLGRLAASAGVDQGVRRVWRKGSFPGDGLHDCSTMSNPPQPVLWALRSMCSNSKGHYAAWPPPSPRGLLSLCRLCFLPKTHWPSGPAGLPLKYTDECPGRLSRRACALRVTLWLSILQTDTHWGASVLIPAKAQYIYNRNFGM